MNYQTQSTLTIWASGILLGAAGFWIAPNPVKGAIAGAATGTIAAAGHIRNNRHIRQLASKQKETRTILQVEINNLSSLISQADKVAEDVTLNIQKHDKRITEVEKNLRGHPHQSALSPNEINSIRKRLRKLELNSSEKPLVVDEINHTKLALETTENSVIPSTTTNQNKEYKSITTVNHPVVDKHEELEEDESSPKVIAWFMHENIEVESYYEPDPKIDRLLDGLSLYLGDNYTVLQKFHRKLRTNVGTKTRFSLADHDSREKSIHNQYLKKLKSSDYLSIGRLIKKQEGTDFIIAESYKRRPDIQGFFDGGWFERFIYYKVVELFDSEGIDYQYLRNPKILDNNEDSSELDLVFLVNGKPLLIECKAGQNYYQGIEKFDKHRQRLNLDANSAIFVVLDIDENEAHLRNSHWNITVVDQNIFLIRIQEIITISENFQHPSQEEEDNEEKDQNLMLDDTDNDTLESFFKRQKLNLSPESRSVVFNGLVQLVETSNIPESFNAMTKTLRDNISNESSVSRRKIREILHCLLHFGFFRNERNKPIRNASKAIYSMASMKPQTFEKKCMEFYAEKILNQFDPDFFEKQENIDLFESLTLGSSPSPEKIHHVKERQGIIRPKAS